MKSVKTPEQIEFNDLFVLLESAGWTRAQVSRALDYSSGAAVTMILKGKTGVSELRLKKMRELVDNIDKAKTHVAKIEATYLDEATMRQFNDLPAAARKEVVNLFNVIVGQAVSRVTTCGAKPQKPKAARPTSAAGER